MLSASTSTITPPLAVAIIVIGLVAIVGCIAMLLHRDATNSFFKGAGTRMYGERVANKVYKPGRLIFPGIVGIVIGAVFVIVGILHL